MQFVKGRGVWKNGTWSVTFMRELEVDARNENAVFGPDRKLPAIAFAIWNGSRGDRRPRRAVLELRSR